jgi:hypothetical protein
MDDKADSALSFEKAAFPTFDMTGTVSLAVSCRKPIRPARVLQASPGTAPRTWGCTLSFDLDEPRPGDPRFIFFGPGLHEVAHLEVGSGSTLCVAGGGVVRGVITPGEPFGISDGSRSTANARNLLLVTGSMSAAAATPSGDASTGSVFGASTRRRRPTSPETYSCGT